MSNMADERAPRESAVQSVDRAIDALDFLARTGEAGVGETAAAVGVHKSTASRLLAALAARDLVEATGERGRYRLGFGLLRLAGAMSVRLDVIGAGREICDRLAGATGETVNLAVRRGDDVVNVHQSVGSGALVVDNWVGRSTPLHATSSGKVLLAFGSEPDGGPSARPGDDPGPGSGGPGSGPAGELFRYTPHTITSPADLGAELERVRRTGLATTTGEYEVGLNAVAAPVFAAGGRLVAALSLSGPAFRLPRATLTELGAQVALAAGRIGTRMGHQPGGTGTPAD